MIASVEQHNRRLRGVGLIEVVIAIGITATIAVALLAAMPKWQQAYSENNSKAYNNDKARDAFTKMCDEIRESGPNCPDWNLFAASSTMTFNRCIGASFTTKQWGAAITYSYNAQNKTLVRTSGGASTTFCGNVQSLTFTPQGNNVQIALVIQTTSTKSRTLTSNLSGLVALRN
jgi:Tfp pilus assembly protein PilW